MSCNVVAMFAESLDEDWEKDFDVEVTEQELEAAKERLKNASAAAASLVTGDDVDAGKVSVLCILCRAAERKLSNFRVMS